MGARPASGVREPSVRARSPVPPIPAREVLLAAAIAGAVVAPFLWLQRRHLPMPIDLAVYRLAGLKVLHHLGHLYARGGLNVGFGRQFGASFGVGYPFTYPPFAALLAVPLALVGPITATVLWTALSMVLLACIVAVAFGPLLERFDRRRWIALAVLVTAAGVIVPVYDTLFFGQINLILVALCLWDCRRAGSRQGTLVGLATALKVLPGLFVLYFLVTRRLRPAVRAVAVAAACTGVAALVLPHPSLHYWTHLGLDLRRIGGVAYYGNQSLNGAIHRLGWPAWAWAVEAVPVLGVGLWRAKTAHDRGAEVAGVALVGLTILLVSPISWEHHAVWALLAIGWLAGDGTDRRKLAAAAGVAVALVLRLPQWGSELVTHHVLPPLGGILEDAYVLVFVGLLLWLPLPRARVEAPLPAGTLAP